MLVDYSDITERISEPPKWHDENGVPRYCEFTPLECGVYITEAALLLTRCQECHREFRVSVTYDRLRSQLDAIGRAEDPALVPRMSEGFALWRDAAEPTFWDDPPRHGRGVTGCLGGDMMSSEVLGVLEFHSRVEEWVRVPELEFSIPTEEEEAP